MPGSLRMHPFAAGRRLRVYCAAVRVPVPAGPSVFH